MRLDQDLIREMLLVIEASDKSPQHWVQIDVPPHSAEVISYHVHLLYEAGIIDAQDASSLSEYRWHAKRLTYQGHEFLDAIRDISVWRATKAAASKAGGASISFLWEIAKAELRTRLGLPIG